MQSAGLRCPACSPEGSCRLELPGGFSLSVPPYLSVRARGFLLLDDLGSLLPGDLACARLVALEYGLPGGQVCVHPGVLVWSPHSCRWMVSSGTASWVPPLAWRVD